MTLWWVGKKGILGGKLVAPDNSESAEQYQEHIILLAPHHSSGFSPGRSVNLSVCIPSDNSLRNQRSGCVLWHNRWSS